MASDNAASDAPDTTVGGGADAKDEVTYRPAELVVRKGRGLVRPLMFGLLIVAATTMMNFFLADYFLNRGAAEERAREDNLPPDEARKLVEIEKLRQEVANLRTSNDALGVRTKQLTTWATAVGGTLVSLIVLMATIYYNRTQREKLKQDLHIGEKTLTLGGKKQELENRKLEQELRFNEQKQLLDQLKLTQDKELARESHLLNVFEALGNTEPRVRLGAVAILVQRVSGMAELKKAAAGGGVEEARELVELDRIISVLISVTKYEDNIDIQKYIADGVARGLNAILDPDEEEREREKPRRRSPKGDMSPLKEYDFQGAQLRNAWWYSVDARGVDFYKANLSRAGLRLSLLSKATLKNADLTNAVLKDADLTETNLEGATLVNAKLQGAVLVNANLKKAILTKADLEGADLGGAKLEGADVTGVDFSKVKNLSAEQLKGTVVAETPAALPQENMKGGEMPKENEALIRRWFEEVWNKGRAEAIEEMFAEDGVAHGLAGEDGAQLRGPADFRVFHGKFREAFPGIEVVVDDAISEGDRVAARCTVRGRHEGDSLGFAATRQPVEFTGMTFARVRDGKIVEAWNSFDFMSMFRQLGALRLDAPPADAAGGGGEALPSLD